MRYLLERRACPAFHCTDANGCLLNGFVMFIRCYCCIYAKKTRNVIIMSRHVKQNNNNNIWRACDDCCMLRTNGGREKIAANTQEKEETATQPKSNCKHIIKHEVNRDDSIVEYMRTVVRAKSLLSAQQALASKHSKHGIHLSSFEKC